MMSPPQRVTIVGRDAALWLTATALQRALAPTGVAVVAVELPTALSAASIHVSLPPLEALHAKLGLEESALLDATGGSFSLGYNVVGPAGTAPFFLAHGSYGAPIDGSDFFHYWNKAQHYGLGVALEHFSLTAMAARQGRMMLPDAATSVFGRTDYGYHLPALAYAAALKTYACGSGLVLHQARNLHVERDSFSGAIRAVRLDDGSRIESDLFVDATGADRLLIGPGRPGHCDAADRRLIARAPAFTSIAPYSELRIGETGWAALHATPAATYVVHIFSAAEQSDEEALAAASRLSGLALADAVVAPAPSGASEATWAGNCIAIGASARAFDPLFDCDLHVIQLGIVHLLSLFPATADFAAERAEYNRITTSAFDRLADLASAFYAANRFHGVFWDRTGAAAAPEPVALKLATFRARGEIPPMEDETFAPDFWRAMLVGLGERAESWPPAIDRTPPERMKQEFRRMLAFVRDKVLEQPTHDSCLSGLGRSRAA
ncbi:MAG TPA: tryptophan 7-halogenase [Sphingomonas sp.]|nr:tryptophan 7-halogenase [Sphingomonas sp.]